MCINKEGGYHSDPHEAISNFGWMNESSEEKGNATLKEMVDFLDKGNKAYVRDARNDVAYLEVKTSWAGHKYVRTIPDGIHNDNLLALGECRVR